MVARSTSQKKYIPERGDVVWLDLDPSRGHEQRGIRPVFVISPSAYNKKTGLMLACPVTSQKKGYAFEVAIDAGAISGVILSDHIRSTDWRVRKARFAATASPATTEEVEAKLRALIEG